MPPSIHTVHRPILLLLARADCRPPWLSHDAIQGAFDVLEATNLAEADRLAKISHPDLFLTDGPVARRDPGSATGPLDRLPIILVGPVETMIPGEVPAGVAEVLPHEVGATEAAIHLRAVLRRLRPTALAHRVVHGGLEIDHHERRVLVHGRPILLSLAQFNLLALLLEEPGRTWSFAEIGRVAWGPSYRFSDASVRRLIQLLRSNLGDADGKLVETVRGKGFRVAREPGQRTDDNVA